MCDDDDDDVYVDDVRGMTMCVFRSFVSKLSFYGIDIRRCGKAQH